MNDSFGRKYVWILAGLAAVILAAGGLLRPKKAVPEPPSPSETAYLQARLRTEELGNMASYFEQRAQAYGRFVHYLSEGAGTGIPWRNPGEFLIPDADDTSDAPLSVVQRSEPGQHPPEARAPDTGRWLLVVGRTSEDKLLWVPAVLGGTRRSSCSGAGYDELLIDSRLDPALLGAGAFDLSGALAGVVLRCDGALHLISSDSVDPFIKQFQAPEHRMAAIYGFRLAETKSSEVLPAGVVSGLLVTDVTDGLAAAAAGLRAGDIIVEVGGEAAPTKSAVAAALGQSDPELRTLTAIRNGKRITIRMEPIADAERLQREEPNLGINLSPSDGTPSIAVRPGTLAHKAGLRTGDRIIQAGGRRIRSASDFQRVLASSGDSVMIVYRRGNAERAVLVNR